MVAAATIRKIRGHVTYYRAGPWLDAAAHRRARATGAGEGREHEANLLPLTVDHGLHVGEQALGDPDGSPEFFGNGIDVGRGHAIRDRTGRGRPRLPTNAVVALSQRR